MLLGEKIRELRVKQGLSQEALAARLGVSRQAVSKWEKNLSYPDTENLLALAAIFGVSSDELAEIKLAEDDGEEQVEELPKQRHGALWRIVTVAVLLGILVFVLLPNFLFALDIPAEPADSMETVEKVETIVSEDTTLPSQRPEVEQTGEFALIWEGDTGFDYLAIGENRMEETMFPFGTTLHPTEREQVQDTDFSVMKLHTATCGALELEYLRIDEAGAEIRDSLSRVSTITAGFETPRGIGVGSDEEMLLDRYGDELLYLLKESGENILCIHDHKYVYSPAAAGGAAVVFYICGGHVAGITIHAGDDRGSDAYRVDDLYVFPVKDGKPDFSHRQEPEREDVDATREVYIALYALGYDANLSAEEIYRHTNMIYSNLRYMDWQLFGAMGEAGYEDETRDMLLRWLNTREALSVDQIEGLLQGSCRSNLDGWYADSYTIAMARAFVAYPEEYIRVLAGDAFSNPDRNLIIAHTAYGCDYLEEFHAEALAAMESLTGDPLRLSEQEWIWGEALQVRLERGEP